MVVGGSRLCEAALHAASRPGHDIGSIRPHRHGTERLQQLLIGGDALPWENLDLFLELTISRSIHHLIEAARSNTIAFFDRGIIDQSYVEGAVERELMSSTAFTDTTTEAIINTRKRNEN